MNNNNKNDFNNKKEYTTKEIVLGIVFLVWFFASIIVMICFKDRDPMLTLIVFGQTFYIF